MSETEALVVRVESADATVATERLKTLARTGGETERATDLLHKRTQALSVGHREATGVVDQLASSVRGLGHEYSSAKLAETVTGLVKAYVGFEVAVGAVRSIIEATREYEEIHARLVGVTGSAEEATAAFAEMDEVSQKTTFTGEEMAGAFVRLSQMGLDPTAESMKSFSNLAAATGSSIENIAEIAVGASLGMYRGLRTIGVKAQADGDQIKVVFRGVTTSIGNDVDSIQRYLVNLGNTAFAGEAERQLDTMGGRIKELGESWDDLARTVGQSIIGDMIKTSMGGAADAVKFLTEAVDALLYTMSKKPKGISEERLFNLNEWISNALGEGSAEPSDYTKTERLLQRISDMRSSEQKKMEQYARDRKELLRLSLSGEVDFDVRSALADLDAAYAGEKKGNIAQDEIEKRKRAAEALARQQEETVKRIYEGAKAENERIREKRLAEIEADSRAEMDLLESLKTPREKAYKDYLFAMGRIANGSGSEDTGPFAGEKSQAIDLIQARYERELAAIEDAEQAKRDALWEDYLTEEEQLRSSLSKKSRMIEQAAREDSEIAKRRDELLTKATVDYENKRIEASLKAQAEMTQNAQALFGHLTEASKNWGGEQSRVYAAMFAVSKAAAVANATVAMAQSMAEAQKLPWPANIPAGIAAAAQGARIISLISQTQYTGAYDKGGDIPAGGRGTVGERGIEIVGPAGVMGREDTARYLSALANQPRPIVQVRSIAAFDTSVIDSHLGSGKADLTIINSLRRNPAAARVALGITD